MSFHGAVVGENLGDRKRPDGDSLFKNVLPNCSFFFFNETEDAASFDKTASSWNLLKSVPKENNNVNKN